MRNFQFTTTQLFWTIACLAAGLGCVVTATQGSMHELARETAVLMIPAILFFLAAPLVFIGRSIGAALALGAVVLALSVMIVRLLGLQSIWMP